MATITLSAVGSTVPVALTNTDTHPLTLLPGVLVILSAGASMTYSVQVTGDDINASGYLAATGNWATFDGLGGQTVSANGTLTGKVSAMRCTITAYTSGTLTFQLIQ